MSRYLVDKYELKSYRRKSEERRFRSLINGRICGIYKQVEVFNYFNVINWLREKGVSSLRCGFVKKLLNIIMKNCHTLAFSV